MINIKDDYYLITLSNEHTAKHCVKCSCSTGCGVLLWKGYVAIFNEKTKKHTSISCMFLNGVLSREEILGASMKMFDKKIIPTDDDLIKWISG